MDVREYGIPGNSSLTRDREAAADLPQISPSFSALATAPVRVLTSSFL
jgi:hypothetical protein